MVPLLLQTSHGSCSQELKPFQELLNLTKASLQKIVDLIVSKSRLSEGYQQLIASNNFIKKVLNFLKINNANSS